MKKRLIVSIVAVLTLSLAVIGATTAYLSAQAQVNNSLVLGTLQVGIVEEMDAPGGTGAVKKEVKVQNVNSATAVDGYVRVMIVPVFRNGSTSFAGDITIGDDGGYTINAPGELGTVTLGFDTLQDWIYHEGAFYYTKPLDPDETTAEALLKTVQVSDAAIWDILEIEVLTEGVQATGGGPTTAWGATISSNGTLSFS